MKKDQQNCPYCEAEEKGISTGWGGSPEMWRELLRRHLEEHGGKCPTCGK